MQRDGGGTVTAADASRLPYSCCDRGMGGRTVGGKRVGAGRVQSGVHSLSTLVPTQQHTPRRTLPMLTRYGTRDDVGSISATGVGARGEACGLRELMTRTQNTRSRCS